MSNTPSGPLEKARPFFQNLFMYRRGYDIYLF